MENYRQLNIPSSARIAKNATLLGDITLGENVTILANATLRSEHEGRIVVGDNTNIQESCCFHLDYGGSTIVGEGCTVGHCAILHGCTIGDNTLVGMGSIIMDNAVIGKNCLIGAGSLVTGGKQIPDGMLVLGSPARPVRALTDEEIEFNRYAKTSYLEDSDNLLAGGFLLPGEEYLEKFNNNEL